ncbi:ABC transporter permease, partial [Enterobacter cloacae]
SISNTRAHAAQFMKEDGVKGVVQNASLRNQITTVVKSLNKIMGVLIVLAAVLGVVILYNLTNINVAERMRELSTIKVLGFSDKEVALCISRAAIQLSITGVFVNWGFNVLFVNSLIADHPRRPDPFVLRVREP